jgi:hypothetical protein
MTPEKRLYDEILNIVDILRKGDTDYEKMLRLLGDHDMSEKEAQKLLDRLIKQVEDE